MRPVLEFLGGDRNRRGTPGTLPEMHGRDENNNNRRLITEKGESMKKHVIAGGILALTLLLDIFTKHAEVNNISLHERINVFGSFVQLTLIYNRGGLFGILQGYQMYFLIISIVVLVLLVLFYIFEKEKRPLFCYSMALIVSGAVGNIIDRISGRPGVVDFIYIGNDEIFRWPAFNVADSVIVVGAILLLIVYIQEELKRKSIEVKNQ